MSGGQKKNNFKTWEKRNKNEKNRGIDNNVDL